MMWKGWIIAALTSAAIWVAVFAATGLFLCGVAFCQPVPLGIVAYAGQSFVDALGNTWTLTAGGVIQLNGVNAGTTSNVIKLIYLNGQIYQQNSGLNWWIWSGTTWTSTANPLSVSPQDTSIPHYAQLVDLAGNVWKITAGVVTRNSVNTASGSSSITLAYINQTIYFQNAAGAWFSWTGASWQSVTSPYATQVSAPNGWYVAPVALGGSDSNVGTDPLHAFLTLTKARDAARSSSQKTIYVRQGTYTFAGGTCSSDLTLTSADNGEKWSYYTPDGYNSAVLDGQNQTTIGIWIQGGSNITVDGIKIVNNTLNGVHIYGGVPDPGWQCDATVGPVGVASGNTISNNEITGMTLHHDDAQGIGAGISAIQWTTGTSILDNYIHDVSSHGIVYGTSSRSAPPADHSATTIRNNVIIKSNNSNDDNVGAIYGWNPSIVKSTCITIDNNFIRDYSGYNGTTGHAIFLDYEASNVSITNNIITGATNAMAMAFYDSNNVSVSNNIIDVGFANLPFLFFTNTGNQDGSGNSIQHNIVLSCRPTNAPTVTGTDFVTTSQPITYIANVGSMTPATIGSNFYCNYNAINSAPWFDGGTWNDASPVHCSADPGIFGYGYTIGSPSGGGVSPVLQAPINFVPIASTYGPPNFALPNTGTAPSVPLNGAGAGVVPLLSSVANDPNYVLAFDEEFSGTLDTNWSSWWGPPGGCLEDPCSGGIGTWVPQPQVTATIANGIFTLDGPLTCPGSTGSAICGSQLFTKEHYSTFVHGYIEGRFQLSSNWQGWPAFWLLGNGTGASNGTATGGWPGSGEIDILEFINVTGELGNAHVTVHWGDPGGGGSACSAGHCQYEPTVYNLSNYTTGWHTWGLLRTSNTLTFYIDNVQRYQITASTLASVSQSEPVGSQVGLDVLFNSPMHIILTNNNGGNHTTSWAYDAAHAPQAGKFLADYVRVWSAP
jgi:hypothetical protein